MEKVDISTILASAIHESKNQVGTLLYQLQTVKESLGDKAPQNKKIVHIEESLKKLNDEWVEYLYLYRLASDGYELHPDTFLMEEFLDDQVFALSSSANAKKLELSFDCETGLSGSFDERLMTAVVSTGVYNAFRYAKSSILLSAYKEDQYLIITVEDDGPGFNEDEEHHLDALLDDNTGLGLYFAELSANAHSKNNKLGFTRKSQSTRLGGACLSIHIPQSHD
ncbi:HAMP domain-containing sensor histidine kinase [Marinomonas sp. THO17]|uniref:sensor histidine kinase n=1 Tax=Marinomonas sp. THO17 TaxID=3149048 RepID=UPI00336C2D7B